ncbi:MULTISPECIES: Kdo(2)-lipid IV(A) acyltransferase [Plesiomonas]|jgi:Kdo2-lipid IVA lauroyltransferase/acyltransferase|uniref:Lipid A biosynthesis acyltransferase n=1 Tax=Plesiomonas shigelloides 302-73 TaxID=1315976 RepID=R8ATG7_PLESH|nr:MULTISPECIES: Kdo(2)-lipid IV(A) acyltransferase [Plesiomonas]EON89632.1 lipid A biosynthesis lauroyl acyltransferase [Plesiomonas shigelloides 302-73]KAB7676265.1 LpxL/LpxP family Kdo(2)-lipid IV(A) lauroyl/palmitoleoyl acyltransferase [Plesiomonas shigelloides]KAB7691521.1 LpxL/LpxP family Kdo(2)-lipid IV(A) lauroyl/palmitoleoyl acyltransferase [Plesiomonas shigelloides]KAB7698781.1 LpxL/LpxP family Kdo(2)-lipid IV(A) lauroyl/palmitoleoyl acyltransferase [Plesiomonas shigelloides]KAB77039
MVQAQFRTAYFHPRYWLTWLGIAALYLVTLLPYPLIRRIGFTLGRLFMRIGKRRVKIAERNLELCFPDMSREARAQILQENFESTGMAVMETGMAWFWPDWRVKKIFQVEGLEHMRQAQAEQRGVLLIGVHFLTLELGARVFGMYNPGVGVYRPNDNPLMDWLQTWGRLRSNKYMIDRKDVKGMIRALRAGEIIWYAPDHDYGPRRSVFVPLFAVDKAATTTGTSILMQAADPALVAFAPIRNKDGSGYRLVISPAIQGFPMDDEVAAAAFMNRVVEKEILRAPGQYMWLHRRFKTRPEGESSLY